MEEIKDLLLKMQQQIVDEIEEDRNKSESAVTSDIGDSIDHANEERSRELYQLLCERDLKKLDQIKEALERMKDDDYGVCESCGDDIAKKRLMAMPFTRLCIKCKNEEERTTGSDVSIDSPTHIPDISNEDDYS